MLRGFLHPDFTGVVDQFRRLLPASDGGASLAILHRGEVVVEVAGGTRDASGAPFLTDTVALSFSTTKGVASTLVHILASQGRIDYDAPVATYWPAFGQNGKETITVRDVLCHEAGLFSIRALVDDASEMLDWAGMLRRIEQARPAHAPGESRAYHAVTYGWLVGGLIEKVTGKPFAEVLRDELAMPLGLRGCFVGLPRDEMHRRAHLFGAGAKRPDAKAPGAPPRRRARTRAAKLGSALRTAAFKLVGGDPASFKEALMPRGIANVDWNDEATLAACIPAANGAFDARSLARMYAMLANGGELDGVRLLSPETVRAASTVQSRGRDGVLWFRMGWRLGYHGVMALGVDARQAFGHYGFGGSGAFCDPSRKLAVALVLNHGVGTPMGDTRIWRLGTAALKAADAR